MRRLPVILLLLVMPVRGDGASPVSRLDFKATMSDQVVLEASLYVPQVFTGELPLIVRQHGGGSNKDNEYDTRYAKAAVGTGRYAALLYSHRGHGGSGGSFDFFGPRTTKDFSEMLDALEARFGVIVDTSNVGVSGYSQGGGESLLPAIEDDRVKVAAVGQTFASLNHALNPNDCFKFSWATGIFAAAYKAAGARTQDELALRWGATFYTDTEDVGSSPSHPSTTDELAARSPETFVEKLDIPIFWTQAWEDQLFPGDHPERILGPLQSRGIPVHYWFSSGGHAAGPNFPAEEIAREAAMVEWFDEFLLGIDRGYASGARPVVDYWQRTKAGKPGEWRHLTAAAWPLPDVAHDTWHARAGGGLTRDPGSETVGMIVNDVASANVANDAIVHEIAGRVPGMGDVLNAVPEGANPLDTVRFTSPPLAEHVEVTGAPRLSVPMETTAHLPITVAAKVWDVGPSGAQLVWRGCATVDPVTDVVPGFSLWPNSHVFEPGHHIVLTISHVDFPMFKPDPVPAVTTLGSSTSVTLPTR